MSKILTLWRWMVAALFRRGGSTSVGALALDPVYAPVVVQEKPVSQSPRPAAPLSLTWHLRSTILERLDEYFVCVRRLRLHDPAGYALFSKIGFAVPPDALVNPDAVSSEALKAVERVSFGGILYGGLGADDGRCYPSFVYFEKVRQPGRVQQASGDVYRLSALYDDRVASRRWRASVCAAAICHVCLSKDGEIQLLKESTVEWSRVSVRHGRRRERMNLKSSYWVFPFWLCDMAVEHGKTPHELARHLFTSALLTYIRSTDRIVVRASKMADTAAFGIELDRAKHFFADRAIEVASDGRRKRIFHAVTAHRRVLGIDRETQVRSHYRGARRFDWNGYSVNIVLPANVDLYRPAFTGQYLDEVDKRERPAFMNQGQVGELLAAELSR